MGNFLVPDKFRSIVCFESEEGLAWKPSEPLIFRSRELKYAERGTQLVYRMERPFLYIENDEPKVFFTAILPKLGEEFSCNVHIGVREES